MQWEFGTAPEFGRVRPVFVLMVGQGRVLEVRLKTPTTTGSTVTEKERKGVDNDFRNGQWSFNGGGVIAHCRSFVYPQRFGLSPCDAGAHSIDCVAVVNTRLYMVVRGTLMMNVGSASWHGEEKKGAPRPIRLKKAVKSSESGE